MAPPSDLHTTPRGHSQQRVLVVSLVLVVGLALSALASWQTRIAMQAEAKARFIGESERLATELVRQITQPSAPLLSLRASMAVMGRMGRLQFRRWVAERDQGREFPGIPGLGFIERIPRALLPEHLARERADHAPEFAVKTRGDAPELFVVTRIEPIARNRQAFGLDIGSERVRREAAERAIESGNLALTGPIALVQDEQHGSGWLLLLPVFLPDQAPTNAAERQAALMGLVYAPIRAAGVLAPLVDFAKKRLQFRLLDGTEDGQLIYDSARATPQALGHVPLLTSRWPLQIAGRKMTLQIASTPLSEAQLSGWASSVVLLAGISLSLLLGIAVSRVHASRDAAEARSQRARRDLAEHQQLIALMLDSIPAQLSYWDRDLRCRLVNRAVCAALQATRDELIGRALSTTPLGARFLTDAQSAIQAALRGETQQWESAETLPDGRQHTTLTHFLPDRRGDETLGIVILTLDISDLKNAQNVAQQANQAKSRFLSNMSHDMRTPMHAVLGMLGLLRATPLDAQQDDYAMKAERAARSLLALINGILDFSKIEAGKMTLDPRPVSLRALLNDVSVFLQASLGDKPVALRIHCDPGVPPLLLADDLRLRQVLTNLGDNAIKFTHRGEVEVRIDQLAQVDSIAELEISVRDTGIGISAEAQARLFDDYAQGSKSTVRHFGGTGLGLSICRRLVALMGSELKVDSVPGEGSRFSLRLSLPLSRVPADNRLSWSGGKDDVSARPLAGLRLLLVEDNEVNQQVGSEILSTLGASVTVAGDGLQAVQRLEQGSQDFDAVLMDLQMPVMDGYAATAQIRTRQGPRLPIIAMTASAFDSDREAVREAGMDGHIEKPINVRGLIDTLLSEIGKRRRRSDDCLPV